ncbi:LysR family transcriptional regulator [Asticcacaulis sp. AC466]|uniref:LysR family transcriptional regulator n=1 Tax=Asticcacaulis sp. AC466 TaxID=1282362 RepID=UPI001F432258|nr:LysR family transcriptional regulator [Asticcacaulis sp. AC466]
MRQDSNRFGDMEAFVRVVDLGGFSPAARDLGLTPSAVSKLISRLEARLGSRLINRSTRKLLLTPEGELFFERSVRLLADLDDTERSIGAHRTPRGRLRVSVNVPVGRRILLPLVPHFLALYPEVELDISMTDLVVDLYEQRTDVALRSGPMKSSGLMARKLGETRLDIVASPAYLARYSTPRTPGDLVHHRSVGFGYSRMMDGWPLVIDGRTDIFTVPGPVKVGDGDSVHRLCLDGLGLARLARYMTAEDVAQGRLVPVLEAYNPGDIEELHAVYLGQGGHMPGRIRAFLDFLGEHVRMG